MEQDKLYRNKEWLASKFKEFKTPSKVADETGYPRTCITRYALKYNIYNPKYNRSKRNYVDENYFKEIDTKEKAYFLGFIMADGNVYQKSDGKYQFSIKIKATDKDILYKFAKAINFDPSNIKEREEVRGTMTTRCAEIKIYNQVFCNNLIDKNVIPRKTGKEVMPDIKKKFKRDFIRGYIDGDGWIGKSQPQVGFCSSSLKIMEQMVNYIKSELNIELKIIDQKDCYVVKTYAKKKVYQLIKHFYYKDCISLDRKKSIALKSKDNIIDTLIGSL